MKKNVLIIGLLILAIAVTFSLRNKEQSKPKQPVASASHQLPRLLDLGAGTCIPCKMMAPILDEMKESFAGQLNVEFIDVWEDQAAGQQYGIRMIPTQIFYDANGNELFRHEGFFAREDMLAKWAEFGIILERGE